MERSDKQRKPVAIKNLSELKRFIQPGVEFKTLSQKNHPDLVGLTRVVTTVQTVCFYSKIKDQPNSRFSTDNGGKGFRTDFAKADAYAIANQLLRREPKIPRTHFMNLVFLWAFSSNDDSVSFSQL